MSPGLEHLAFKMRSLADLLGNYRRLKTIGIAPFMTIHHGGTLSAYYLDPDGVQVETFIDTQVVDLSIEEMSGDRFGQVSWKSSSPRSRHGARPRAAGPR